MNFELEHIEERESLKKNILNSPQELIILSRNKKLKIAYLIHEFVHEKYDFLRKEYDNNFLSLDNEVFKKNINKIGAFVKNVDVSLSYIEEILQINSNPSDYNYVNIEHYILGNASGYDINPTKENLPYLFEKKLKELICSSERCIKKCLSTKKNI